MLTSQKNFKRRRTRRDVCFVRNREKKSGLSGREALHRMTGAIDIMNAISFMQREGQYEERCYRWRASERLILVVRGPNKRRDTARYKRETDRKIKKNKWNKTRRRVSSDGRLHSHYRNVVVVDVIIYDVVNSRRTKLGVACARARALIPLAINLYPARTMASS